MKKQAKDWIKKSFSFDRKIMEDFERYCEATGRSQTKTIEIAIKEYMKNHPAD